MKKVACFFAGSCFLFLTSCGSSSSTPSGSGGEEDGTTIEVADLSVLPNLDLDAADTTSASLSVPVGKSVEDGDSAEGGTATAGCYAINFMKPTALAQLKQAEMFKCYVKAMVDDESSDVTVGSEDYNYYLIGGIGDGSGGPEALRVRLGNFTSDSTTTFKMDVCNSNDGSTFSREVEFNIAGNTTTKTWSGFATTHFTFPEESQPETPGGDPITGAFNNSTFTVVMDSAEAMQTDFDFANTSSLVAVSTFGRSPSTDDVESGTTYTDGFRVTFEKETTTDYTEGLLNTVIGTFSNGSTMTGIDYAQFTKLPGATGRGAAAFQFTNSAVPDSNFDSAEAFSVSDPDAEGDVTVTVTDETGAEYAALYAAVDAVELAALTLDVPDDVNSATAFTGSWACTDADGVTAGFTSVSMAGIDVTACDALSDEISTGSSKGGDSCFGEGQQGGEGQRDPADMAGTYTPGSWTCPGSAPTSITVSASGSTVTFTLAFSSSPPNTFTGTGSLTGDFVLAGTGGPITVNAASFAAGTISYMYPDNICGVSGYTRSL